MSEHWLDIQSFLSDEKILAAIDDLSIGLKFELSGINDAERQSLAGKARKELEPFLRRLGEVSTASSEGAVKGVDPRFKALADAYALAQRDLGNYRSTLMKAGAESTIALLHASEPRAKRELLACLTELRRVVERHQQVDVSMILEEF